MRFWKWVVIGGMAVVVSVSSAQQRDATTQPGQPAPRRSVRLWAEWAKMQTLSDDQRLQIYTIHREFLAAQRELEDRQRQQIIDLLTQDQKEELQQVLEQMAIDRKTRDAIRRGKILNPAPTSQPSDADIVD